MGFIINEMIRVPHFYHHFNSINDKYGHVIGDQVLMKFVALITSHIGKHNRLHRFGGEEFVLLARGIGEERQVFIDELRKFIKKNLKTPGDEEITVLFEVAQWLPKTTADTWLKCADEALYQAKAAGRDRAVSSPNSPSLHATHSLNNSITKLI